MTNDPLSHWDEETSAQFLDYGKYFIPAREQQMHIMVELLRNLPNQGLVLELCCGEGLLAKLILDTLPGIQYSGLDGSALMLEKASHRLTRFGERARLAAFELADGAWRKPGQPLQAVVSSMSIHHLEAEAKRALFKDVYAMISPGGAFVIADMVEPVTPAGLRVAADAWDEVVHQRSIELDGSTTGLDFFLREHWNTFRYPDPDDIDHPSPLINQLKWLEEAGFANIEVHFMLAGHALFSGWKLPGG